MSFRREDDHVACLNCVGAGRGYQRGDLGGGGGRLNVQGIVLLSLDDAELQLDVGFGT